MARPGSVWLVCGLVTATLALLLAIGAVPLDAVIEGFVQRAIRQQVVWKPDSPAPVAARYGNNSDPSMPPLHSTFRFLNITNLADVRKGAKPVLQEVGPYTFQALKVKTHVEWVGGGTGVRWLDFNSFLFEPENSNGSLDDPITTLNVPLAGAVEVIGSLGLWKAKRILQILAGWIEHWGDSHVQGLFTTRTVGELLFGYEDPLLKQLARFVPGLDPAFRFQPNMTSPCDAERGFPTQASTGLDDLASVWQMQEWRNVTAVSSWAPQHLERVRGSDGAQFRPGLALGDSVELWLDAVYRAVPLVAAEERKEHGVPLLRLRIDPAALEPDDRFFQYVKGLFNLTSPTAGGPGGPPGKPGPPIFLSRPHYCGADPSLAEGVEGLQCDPHRHDTHIDIEPNTGITLGASVRLMMSSWFGRKWSMIDGAVQDTTLPIFWVEVASKAMPKQLRQIWPLLWARTAQRFLRQRADVAAATLAILAVFALAAGAVLRWGGAGEIAVAGAAADGGNDSSWREGAGVRVAQREPLLPASHPVGAEEDGVNGVQQPEEDGGEEQQGQGIVASVLSRFSRLSSRSPGSVPAASGSAPADEAQQA